jgi:hypothetical protein
MRTRATATATVLVVFTLATNALEAGAQEMATPRGLPASALRRLRSVPAGAPAVSAPMTPLRARDSLINGAVLGALLGAIALGTAAGVICKAQQEPTGPSCVPDLLRIAAMGAGAGAGVGVAIDAATTRGPTITVRVQTRF